MRTLGILPRLSDRSPFRLAMTSLPSLRRDSLRHRLTKVVVGRNFLPRLRIQDVFNPITTINVGVLVDVIDLQACTACCSKRCLPDSQSSGEGPERVELVRVDYPCGNVLNGFHRVIPSCFVMVSRPTHSGRHSRSTRGSQQGRSEAIASQRVVSSHCAEVHIREFHESEYSHGEGSSENNRRPMMDRLQFDRRRLSTLTRHPRSSCRTLRTRRPRS